MRLPVDLDELLQRESSHVEWKRGVADVEGVVKKLSAFANDYSGSGTGGWVICGVEEGKDEHGFPQARKVGLEARRFKELHNQVLSDCRERVHPPLLLEVFPHSVPGDASKRILIFHVPASRHVHSVRLRDQSTRFYITDDSQTVEAKDELLHRLLEQKRAAPPLLERPCLDASLEDLNPLAAEEFLRAAKLPGQPADYLEPDHPIAAIARPLVLSRPTASGERLPVPTYLALLLFGREPTKFLPGAYLFLTVYEEIERTAAYSQRYTVDGPLPKVIEDVLGKLDLYTGVSIDKSSSAREKVQNRPRYSQKALQEALVNAFAHRDYASSEPIRITVFPDRIEIVSPGGLMPGVDGDRLAHGEFSRVNWRNPALASFLLRMPLAQAQNEGQGIPTIYRETLEIAGRPAKIRPGSEHFEVVLPAYDPAASKLAAPPETAEGNGRDGLILISIGSGSILDSVRQSLDELGLLQADLLVDLSIPDYVHPDRPHWELEARKIRQEVRRWVEGQQYARLHLFYRGPVIMAPLLGALIVQTKPLLIYYYENGRYELALQIDRRFLISRD